MSESGERPNILWICTDQQRYDTIASLGNPAIRTPNIDQLVREGVTFEEAYCQSVVCTPSRASFLTGRYPRTTRCRQNGQSIPASERLVTKLLSDIGYHCGLAGKLHLASCSDGKVEERIDDGYQEFYWSHHPQPDWPENAYSQWLTERGVDWHELLGAQLSQYVQEGVPAEYHQTTWCADQAIDFMQRNAGKQPWLFSFNCFDPHHPFDPPADYLARYPVDSVPLPVTSPDEVAARTRYQRLDAEWAHDEPGFFHVAGMTEMDRRQVTAAYYAMIELIDDQVGRMLTALEESGQADNTLVIFMSDHGELLGDHGLYLKGPHFFESAIRVPLVMRWPASFKPGTRISAMVELVDLAPTLMEAAGIGIPVAMQGKSLSQLCRGENTANDRDSVYCEYYNSWTHHRSYGTMLRTKNEKIVLYHGTGEGEFYDLAFDPDEFHNLWNSPSHQDRREQLLRDAFDKSVFTMDPLPERRGAF